MSFEPDRYQMLGFGPAGISYSAGSDQSSALKTMNPEGSSEYLQSIRSPGPSWNRYFQYDEEDMQRLHLTRRLAALRIEMDRFHRMFGVDAWNAFSDRFSLLIDEGLLTQQDQSLWPTPQGIFYADSLAGFLAEGRLRNALRSDHAERFNDNRRGYM